MAVLIIYSNYNHKVTEKVLTPENTHIKGNINISGPEPKSGKSPQKIVFKKFLK